MSEQGYVYFISTHREKEVKIGWAVDVKRRLSQLQTGHPYELLVAYSAPGTQADERALHERFSELRLHGEWFRYTEEIHDFLYDLEDAQIAIGLRCGDHTFDTPLRECLPYIPD